MDSTLSHEAVSRFEKIEANLKKLFEHNGITSVEEDEAKAQEEAAKAALPEAPADPRDAEIAELKAQLAKNTSVNPPEPIAPVEPITPVEVTSVEEPTTEVE